MSDKIIRCKLVSQGYTTHGGMFWAKGVINKATEPGNTMCTKQVLHCYADPYLAVLFNPLHADMTNPRLIEVECDAIVADDGLKQASKRQTMLREIKLPVLSTLQKVEFAIRCAMLVYTEEGFVKWANNWISGTDTTEFAARSAWSAARSVAWSAAESAAASAAWSVAEFAAWSAARSAARSVARKKFIEIINDIVDKG